MAKYSGRKIKAYEKSIVMGGNRNLYPLQPHLTESFAKIIQDVVRDAEAAAYQAGVYDTQDAFKKALGIRIPQ